MPSVPFEQWNPRFGSPDLYQTINQHQTSLDVTITVTKAYADEGRTIIAYTLSAPGTTKHLLVGAFDLTSPTPQKPEVLFATECDAPQDAGHAVLSGAASLPGSSGSQHTAACVGGQTTDRERYSNDPPRIVAILLHGAIPSRAPAGPTRPRARCSVPVLSGGRSGAGLARISVHRHPVSMQTRRHRADERVAPILPECGVFGKRANRARQHHAFMGANGRATAATRVGGRSVLDEA